jgi:hypothetical protein
VNDATSVVLFRAVQKFDFSRLDGVTVIYIVADFLYLFFTSTILGVAVHLISYGILLLVLEPEKYLTFLRFS